VFITGIWSTPERSPEAVAIFVEQHEMSERRAYAVIGADRTSIRYRSRRPDDHDLRERLCESTQRSYSQPCRSVVE
jgi:putative transposase